MGKICTLYGGILGNPGSKNFPERFTRLLQENERALNALPPEDEWPPLTRNMFSITAQDYPQPGFYKYQMIHFGASMKDLDTGWKDWLGKFEALLKTLFWDEAFLHLQLEWPPEGFTDNRYAYRWEVSKQARERVFPGNQLIPMDSWTFSGGPRSFEVKR